MARVASPVRWLLEREFGESDRRARRALLAVSALLAMGVGVLIVAIWASRPRELMPFRREVWNNPRVAGQTRYAMAQDLVQRRVLMGMQREELVSLLGPPDRQEYFDDHQEDCLWRLKRCEDCPTDYDWLAAELEHGRVTDAAVEQDEP